MRRKEFSCYVRAEVHAHGTMRLDASSTVKESAEKTAEHVKQGTLERVVLTLTDKRVQSLD